MSAKLKSLVVSPAPGAPLGSAPPHPTSLSPSPRPPLAMAASFLPSAGAPRPRRPPRSSGARRAQEARAQARCVQRLLGGFDALGHRGCRPSRLGAALASALALGGDDGFRHPTPSAPPLPPAGAGGVVPGLVRGASPLQAALSRMFVALPLPQAAEALARVFAAAEAATDGLPGWHAAIDLVTDVFDLLTNTAHPTTARHSSPLSATPWRPQTA